MNAAWGQFKETEDWRRDNALEKLYENIDVDSYEASRRMVRLQPIHHHLRQLTVIINTVPPMDRPSRPPRNPRLCLRNQALELEKHGRLQRNHVDLESAPGSPEIIHRPGAIVAAVRAVRKPAPLRDAVVFDAEKAEPGDAYRDVDEYRGCERGWAEAVLEFEGPYAGCKCFGDGALSGDLGSDFRKPPFLLLCPNISIANLRRSSEPPPSSLQSGAGSNAGLTR